MQPWLPWVLIFTLALLPPLLYAMWLRTREQVNRNPMRVVFGAFFYGGTVGVAAAILLHWVFDVGFAAPNRNFGLEAHFVAVVIAAPIVEELSKGFGFAFLRPHMRELEDGLILGGALGLGFAATENLLYGIDAMARGGAEFGLSVVLLRIFSSMFLHLGASALLGYGLARVVVNKDSFLLVIPYYILAAGLHAAYNALVTLDGFGMWSLGAALVMVILVVTVLQRRIEVLDALPHQRRRAW